MLRHSHETGVALLGLASSLASPLHLPPKRPEAVSPPGWRDARLGLVRQETPHFALDALPMVQEQKRCIEGLRPMCGFFTA